jgi:iron complex outermembrane recepter protein
VVSGSVRHTLVSGISGEVSAEHVGTYYVDDANSVQTPSYVLLGATLGVSRALGEGSVRFFVAGNNLTDEHYVASVFINGTAGEFFEPGLPRSWAAGMTVRWK